MGLSATSCVYVLFEIIRAVYGDVQFYSSYPTTGWKSYSATAGITDRLACVKDICYKEKISKQWMITAGSFYTIKGNCYCSESKLTGFNADVGHQCTHYNFIPVHFRKSMMTNGIAVGVYYSVEVNFLLHKRGNDKTTLYAIEDLNEPLNKSISVSIVSKNEFTDTVEPSKNLMSHLHPVTKLFYSITERFETDHEILSPQYTTNFRVVDNDNHSRNSLWFTMIQENDAMVIVDVSNRLNITRPPFACTLDWRKDLGGETFNVDSNYFEVKLYLKTKGGCNKNIEDVSVVLYHESYLELYEVKAENHRDCLKETSLKIERRRIVIKYSRLYVFSTICTLLKYRYSGKRFTAGSKKVSVFVDVFYTGFVNNVATSSHDWYVYNTYVSKDIPGFYLWDIDLTYCVRQHPEEIMMMQKEALCTLFKQTPYNLLSIYGFCANKNSSTIITSETCGKEKMLSVGSSSLRWFDDQTYIHVAPSSEKGTPVGSSQDNVGFKKKYKDSFGFKVSKEIATDKNTEIADVTIILYGDDFTACCYLNNREHNCVVYNKAANRVTRLPPMFASVLGYDALSKTTIGKDTQGRYVGYRPKGTHRYFYLSQKHWLKLKSKGSTVLSKAYNRSVLAESNAENEFEVGSDLYTVTPLGLYEMTRQTHVILWLVDQDNCAAVVGSSELLAFQTCEKIKAYCHAATTGTYWIGTAQTECYFK